MHGCFQPSCLASVLKFGIFSLYIVDTWGRFPPHVDFSQRLAHQIPIALPQPQMGNFISRLSLSCTLRDAWLFPTFLSGFSTKIWNFFLVHSRHVGQVSSACGLFSETRTPNSDSPAPTPDGKLYFTPLTFVYIPGCMVVSNLPVWLQY